MITHIEGRVELDDGAVLQDINSIIECLTGYGTAHLLAQERRVEFTIKVETPTRETGDVQIVAHEATRHGIALARMEEEIDHQVQSLGAALTITGPPVLCEPLRTS